MLKGIGTDIIEIKRIEKAALSESFLKRCYTKREVEAFAASGFAQSAAGAFAAKEAVAKAFGLGFRGFWPSDIEILKDKNGKPYVNLSQTAAIVAKQYGIKSISISISHCGEYAVAFAAAEGDCDENSLRLTNA